MSPSPCLSSQLFLFCPQDQEPRRREEDVRADPETISPDTILASDWSVRLILAYDWPRGESTISRALVTLFTPWSVINTSDPSLFSPKRVIFIVMFIQVNTGIIYNPAKTKANLRLRRILFFPLLD